MSRILTVVTLTCCTALHSGTANAQAMVATFDELQTKLTPGQTVVVKDTSGLELRGTLTRLTSSEIQWMFGGQPQRAARDRVISVAVVSHRSTWKGPAVGALAGFGTFYLVLSAVGTDCGYWGCTAKQALWPIGFAGIGAVIGAGIDSSVGHERLLYHARPGPAMSLTPVLSPSRRGVSFTVRF